MAEASNRLLARDAAPGCRRDRPTPVIGAILDETDSGLDIDALRIVADGVNALRSGTFSALVITHHQRLLDHLVPDRVHVLSAGRIIRSGGPELAKELEATGYAPMVADAA